MTSQQPKFIDFGYIIRSEGNFRICKSGDGKINYTVSLMKYLYCYTLKRCDERQCSLKCSNCNICVHMFICSCIDFLLCSTICKHIHVVHQYKEKDERKTEICEEPITGRRDDKYEEFMQLTAMVKNKTKLDFASSKKNVSICFWNYLEWFNELMKVILRP